MFDKHAVVSTAFYLHPVSHNQQDKLSSVGNKSASRPVMSSGVYTGLHDADAQCSAAASSRGVFSGSLAPGSPLGVKNCINIYREKKLCLCFNTNWFSTFYDRQLLTITVMLTVMFNVNYSSLDMLIMSQQFLHVYIYTRPKVPIFSKHVSQLIIREQF